MRNWDDDFDYWEQSNPSRITIFIIKKWMAIETNKNKTA